MSASFEVVELDPRRRGDRERFIALPFELARNHPPWHPGLRVWARALVDPRRNPFWTSRRAAFFLVTRAGRVVGRAAVVEPGGVPERPRAATLAFPDFAHDPEAAHLLLDAVRVRARAMGAAELLGPLNPDIHHDVGIQVDGFEHRNAVFMGYQPGYYAPLMDALGFEPLVDFQAWALDAAVDAEDPSVATLVTRVERHGTVIRAPEPARFDEELATFHHLYSASFADHWGFAPPTWEEFRFLAGDLRHVLRRGMALVAERNGQAVGFVLSMPDLHAILPKQRHGRLTPPAVARTLLRWRRLNAVRVLIAGVLPEHHRLGIHLPLLHHLRRHLTAMGYRHAEISWVRKDNRPLQHILPLLGARPCRTYRLYAMRLPG